MTLPYIIELSELLDRLPILPIFFSMNLHRTANLTRYNRLFCLKHACARLISYRRYNTVLKRLIG